MFKKLLALIVATIISTSAYAQSESAAGAGAGAGAGTAAGTIAGVSVATAVAVGAAVVGIAVAADDDDDSPASSDSPDDGGTGSTGGTGGTGGTGEPAVLNIDKQNVKKKILMALLAGPFFFIIFSFSTKASDLGTTGILDIPTARMMQDGELRATISTQDSVNIYSLNYQATPWLETTFRYSGFNDFFIMIEVTKQK